MSSIQDDGKKIIAVSISAVKLTADILKAVLNDFLENKPQTKGKQSLRKLAHGNPESLKNIPVSAENIKDFQRVANKYGVDFSIKKDTSRENNYIVFFKGNDIEQINKAFKEYAYDKTSEKSMFSLAALKELKEEVKSQDKNRDRENTKKLDRGAR